MFLDSIKLKNFRLHIERDFTFYAHKVFIIGPNGSGKSSILEAISTLSWSALNKNESDRQKINFQSDLFSLEADYSLNSRQHKCHFAKKNAQRPKWSFNGASYRDSREIREISLKSVNFKARESLEIIRGAPSLRREQLDNTLCLLNLTYADNLQHYARTLEQRNSLLRSYLEGKKNLQSIEAELEIWDDELIRYGSYLIRRRSQFVREIEPVYREILLSMSGQEYGDSGLVYAASVEEQDFGAKLLERRNLDLRRGQSTVGPHRDDLLFVLRGYQAKEFASQGESRSCALAWHLTQQSIWKERLGEDPLLLLDDVTAELDPVRQNKLFEQLPLQAQVFITTTHLLHTPQIDDQDTQIITLE